MGEKGNPGRLVVEVAITSLVVDTVSASATVVTLAITPKGLPHPAQDATG